MEAILKNLKTAIFNVLERMFFLLPDADEPQMLSEEPDQELIPIYIGIDGDPKYIITFAFDKQLIQSMSADLLGIDEDEVDDDVSDKCLKETANIIAGNFMLSFGSGTERNITLPSQQKRNIFGDFTITESTVMVSQFNGLSMNTIIESIEC